MIFNMHKSLHTIYTLALMYSLQIFAVFKSVVEI